MSVHRTACTQLLHCRPAALPAAFTLTPTLSLVRYERRVSILEAQKKGTFDGE